MARRTRHAVVPLERWIHGRVHVHLRSGHVAVLQTSLHSAHSIRLQADGTEGGERIDGLESHDGWIAARSEEIVLTEWAPDPEYGWQDTSPDDRARLRSLGMKHGILCALAELWAGRGRQPAYSIAAVSTLFSLATKETVTRDQWDRVAEMLEGTKGAQLVASAWEEADRHDVPQELVDDAAEPDRDSGECDGGDDNVPTTTQADGEESPAD